MRQFYTPQQVSAMLQVELPYIYGMIRTKALKAFNIHPGVIRISSEAVDEFVKRKSFEEPKVYRMPEEFRKFSHRAQNIMYRMAMFNSVEELTKYSRDEWLKFRGVGTKTVNEIEALCQEHGFQLREG